MQIVDLSVVLNERTPVYPGDPKTKLETITTCPGPIILDSIVYNSL